MANYYLMHHGVKGMKWGVRRYQNADGSLTPAGQRRQARLDRKEAARSRKLDSKNRRLLSDAELDRKISRIKKEKELRNLTKEEVSPGKQIVKGILIGAGTAAATSVLTGAIKYGIKAAMDRKFDIKDAVDIIVPRPKKSWRDIGKDD